MMNFPDFVQFCIDQVSSSFGTIPFQLSSSIQLNFSS